MRHPEILQTAAVILSTVMLAACGGGSGDEAATATATATAPAATTTSASGLTELPDLAASFQGRIDGTDLFPGASASEPPKVTRCLRTEEGQTACQVEFVPGETAPDRESIGSCEFVFLRADTTKPDVRLRLSKGRLGAAAACRKRAKSLERALARSPIPL